MFNLIYCEFAKLKKSYFYIVLLAIVSFFPLILCLGWLGQGQMVVWNKYIIQIENVSVLFLYLPMLAMIAAYIFTREYSYNTAQTLFCYQASRFKIFLSKLFVIAAVTTAAVMLQLALAFLGGLLLPHEPLTYNIIFGHLRIIMHILIYEFVLLPVAILIALLSRNIIMPIIFEGIVTVADLFLFDSQWKERLMEYMPSLYPLEILNNSFRGGGNELGGIIIIKSGVCLYGASNLIAVSIFVVTLLLCILHYSKADEG